MPSGLQPPAEDSPDPISSQQCLPAEAPCLLHRQPVPRALLHHRRRLCDPPRGARRAHPSRQRSATIAAIKALCERLFKVPAHRQALLLRPPVAAGTAACAGHALGEGEDISGDDTKDLRSFDIAVSSGGVHGGAGGETRARLQPLAWQ